MNLETVSSLKTTRLPFVAVESERLTARAVEFEISWNVESTNEANELAVKTINAFAHKPFILREYSGESPFTLNVQSVNNLIGSYRESLENEIRLSVWKSIAEKFGDATITIKARELVRPDIFTFTVAMDGKVATIRAELRPGPNHRDSCETCQQGKGLLHLAFDLMNGKVFYNLSKFSADGDYTYGESKIKKEALLNFAQMDSEDSESETISKFQDWFLKTYQGPLEMASMEVAFVPV